MSFLSLFEIVFWLLRLPGGKSAKLKKFSDFKNGMQGFPTEIRKQDNSESLAKTKGQKQRSFEDDLKLKEEYSYYC